MAGQADPNTSTTDSTVERTRQAKGGYDVYEVVELSGDLAVQVTGDDAGQVPSSVKVLVYVGSYKGAAPGEACWHAAEDQDAPFGLHRRAQGGQGVRLTAGSTGRGGLNEALPYRLEPVAKFKRSNG